MARHLEAAADARARVSPAEASPAAQVAAALVDLLPSWAAVVAAPVGGPWPADVHAEERAAVAGAVARRRAEHLAGRACAHAALRRLGNDGAPVRRGPSRQPLWPPGVVGTIAHAAGVAAAVVARAGDAAGVGVDLEAVDPPLEPAVERLVASPAERASAAAAAGDAAGMVVFCAKEAVYKCLFPLTGWALDFTDVTVTVDRDGGGYRAIVNEGWAEHHSLPPLHGRVAVVAGVVVTALWLPPFTGADGPAPGTGR